jgi:PIN domain nuclease of toxin-antitoxin system
VLVLDTSALFYWTLDPLQLSATARQAIQEADRLLVSSISIWEIALKVKRGTLQIPLSIEQYVAKLQRAAQLEILPVDTTTWLESVALDWEHRDPADRVIVALARQLKLPLVSNDRKIASFLSNMIW